MTIATEQTSKPGPKSQATLGRRGWTIFAIAGLVAAIGGAWFYREHLAGEAREPVNGAAGHSESSAGHSKARPIPVRTIRLSKGGIVRRSSQVGTVHPYEEADLFAKVSGYLANLHVDYGDHVKRGQPLVEIDDPEIVEDAKKAEADVAQARAAVAQAQAFIESAKADRDAVAGAVEQSIAEVDRYKSMRAYHGKKLARYRELVQSKAIPQQIADEEEEGYESAKANELAAQKAVLKAKADLLAATARIKKSEADLAEAKANVEVALAKLSRANVLVAYTKITSPYDGVITQRNFFRGAFIRSASEGGAIPLLTVARTDKVRVVTQIPDRDVPLTSVGDLAEVTLDALGDRVLRGKVSRFAETEDPTSRTMHTEIDLDNPQDLIRPGMYGIAKIILDTPFSAATLPASCLVGESKDGKAAVYLVKGGKAKQARITLGADDGLRVEVLAGLSPTDDVILNATAVVEGALVIADPTDHVNPPAKAEADPKSSPSAHSSARNTAQGRHE